MATALAQSARPMQPVKHSQRSRQRKAKRARKQLLMMQKQMQPADRQPQRQQGIQRSSKRVAGQHQPKLTNPQTTLVLLQTV